MITGNYMTVGACPLSTTPGSQTNDCVYIFVILFIRNFIYAK